MTGSDADSPSPTSVYDAALGGENNSEADQKLVAELSDFIPDLTHLAAENRRFQARAVTWLARQGIDQFMDLGCGAPPAPNTHENVREVRPDARVAYVDVAAARAIVAGHTAGLAPGSYLLALTASGDDKTLDGLVRVYSAAVGPIYPHGADALAGFLGDFELLPPGVSTMEAWQPGQEATPPGPPSGLTGYCALARVP